ncbi:MAG TPA: hypothetical protein VJS64_03075 [Pyrinomonadaceae bacterium]|nr:hypothetical protein [Pyrinomonadaceae bacterium]
MTIEAWIGMASAAAALMAAIFAFLQARSARRSAVSAEAQLEQARIQAEAARRQAGAAEEQINLMLREMQRTELAEKVIQLEREHQHLARLATAVELIGSTALELCDYLDMSNLSQLLSSGYINSTFERFKDTWQQYQTQSTECQSQLITPNSIAHANRIDEAVEEFRKVAASIFLAETGNRRSVRRHGTRQVRQHIHDHLASQIRELNAHVSELGEQRRATED